ncbi:hypothetical protein KP509_15G037900 [Ceratopteris richardii]|uniref:Ufm1-specific protease n=1 Tax=Ceratopteris richardii TaxID=49495 RepID=A0A8T2T4N0_CERRI|nr:hypothetical protein KP509_15G037900 [Ceratopteris richardii]
MAKHITILCDSSMLENKRKGMQWLVGTRTMPCTVISVIHCLRLNAGYPDIQAESAELRILLPKGLEIVGALLNEVGELEKARKIYEITMEVALAVNGDDSCKKSGLIIACLESADNQSLKFYHGTSQSLNTVESVVHPGNPGAHLWKKMCLLRCKLHIQLPLYASGFDNPSDYSRQLEAAFSNLIKKLRGDALYCIVEGSSTTPRKVVSGIFKDSDNFHQSGNKSHTTQGDSQCSDFCPSSVFTSSHGLQMPMPLNFVLLIHQSLEKGINLAPFAEYLPAHRELSVHEAISSLILTALTDQLYAMRDMLLEEIPEHPELCSYVFCPPGFAHPISCIYNLNYGESEFKTVEWRKLLHQRLSLPMDRPLLRRANALSFTQNEFGAQKQGTQRLSNVHVNMPTSSGVVGGQCSLIHGSYEYYHYLQDSFNDSGWGCAYRSLQTIFSWFKLQNYTVLDVPMHGKIQEILVKIGDKEPSFKGSQNWIGAIELSFVLDELLGVSSKILNVRSGAEVPEKCRELALHFETQGTPVMIGGGVLAYTLLGVDYNDTTGDCAFLILDPHYTGGEDLRTIWAGGWCGWKKPVNSKGEEFFLRDKFYNFLLPQRPNTI